MSKCRTCSPSPLPDVSKLSVEISVLNEYLLNVFISTCFGCLKRFAYEYIMFSCLKSFKIANKGLIKKSFFSILGGIS